MHPVSPTTATNIKAIMPDEQAREKVMLSRLPKPIITIRRDSNKHLTELLETCFSCTDDTLFDLAKNTVKQADQDSYFLAMREIRNQKKSIIAQFIKGVNSAYCELAIANEGSSTSVTSLKQTSFNELAVVGNDDLDEIVALEAMASRATKLNQHALELLTARIKSVVPADPEPKSIPVSPGRLCNLFSESVKTIDISSKPTLVLFKIFEKTVITQLGKLYQIMNSTLMERGILPESQVKNSGIPKTTAPPLHDGSGGLHMPVESFDMPLQTVNTVTTVSDQVADNSSAPLSLIDVLTQHATHTGQDSHPEQNFLSELLMSTTRQTRSPSLNISSKEKNLVTILDRLFNTVNDQAHVSGPAKQLLQKIQLPLAKVALTDHSFFTNSKHGARQLLNTLAEASVRFNTLDETTLNQDPLYKHIQSSIHELINTQSPSAADFSKQLKALNEITEQQAQKEALFEQQLIRAEQGRIASQEIQTLVEATITEVCQGMEIQKAVIDIIDNAWKRVMTHTATKHGEESEQWDEQLQTLIELVTSTQTYANQADLAQAEQSLISLKAKITEGLLDISFDALRTAKLLEKLEATFDELSKPQKGNCDQLIEPPSPTVEATVSTLLSAAATSETPTAAEEPQQQNPTRIAQERTIAQSDVSVSEAFVLQAKNLNRGTWFDFKSEDAKTRCRLAAIIAPHELYIFVNNSGAKVISCTLNEVANMLQGQVLIHLDSSHIFDSALEKVISGIKRAPKKIGEG